MNKNAPVFTEAENCQDCYKCIRECPVKAIGIRDGKAFVKEELCIYCGHCVNVCPGGAKKIRKDLARVKNIVKYNRTVASLAPSYVSEFSKDEREGIVGALKKLGFFGASETALGAEAVSAESAAILKDAVSGVYVSSACPTVVEYIRKYRPEHIKNLMKVGSPLMAHAAMLKRMHGIEKVVFIGPCASKKAESDGNPGLIDAALTFAELREWMDEEGVSPRNEPETAFMPYLSGNGGLYPVDGGMMEGIRSCGGGTAVLMGFSGMDSVKEIINGLDDIRSDAPVFLELLACKGGCVNGPGISVKSNDAVKRFDVIGSAGRHMNHTPEPYDISHDFLPARIKKAVFSDEELGRTLRTMGKFTPSDELNCGGCGYNSCREFAAALLAGMAEEEMCVSYMRKVAQDKATMLLNKIPSGVVLVDGAMKIIESNEKFAALLGSDMKMIFDVQPALKGMDIRKIVPFHRIFSSLIASGEPQIDKDIKYNGGLLHVTAFTVQKHRIVGAVLRDLFVPEVRKEMVVGRSRKIIRENLETVQKIAYLLGENAARTEEMLNTIIESHLNGENDG